MNVLIVGSEGNMGRRYKAILDYYQIPSEGVDFGDEPKLGAYTHIIIATPTCTHTSLIHYYSSYDVPILCEKPITKDLLELEIMHEALKDINLRMVNQYEYLMDKTSTGDSWYNNWNSGKDGLYWDTINIIGLSEHGRVDVSNDSPYWFCGINGKKISIQDMDRAYMDMIFNWVHDPKPNWDYILESHRKVQKLIDAQNL